MVEPSLKKKTNPFYVALLVVGIVFGITACAYGVMTVKMLRPEGADEVRSAGSGLLFFLDQHGFKVLGVELAVLAALTVAAISTDDYWTRDEERR